MLIVATAAALGWVVYTYLFYRHCRREELLQLISCTAEDGMPLAPVLRAYLDDRERGPMKNFWLACFLCVFPVPGFYWFWYRDRCFDRRVEELVRLLENGYPLYRALQTVRGVATRETELAAAVGESTGQLASCLRGAAKRRMSTIWIDLVQQCVYVAVVLIVITSVVGFLSYWIVPKFKKIFADFGADLPELSQKFILESDMIGKYWYVALAVVQVLALLAILLWFSSTFRWYFPGIGSIYRRDARSKVLRCLGLLLETGRTVPESIRVMAQLPFGHVVLERLHDARLQVEQGEPIGESLLRVGLLPARMVPLVHAAERAGNLPWAFVEMADGLYQRTMRLIQRVMQVAFPATVVLLGCLVALVVLSFFLPLVQLVTELA
jgi:type II secretory pathway component PulF